MQTSPKQVSLFLAPLIAAVHIQMHEPDELSLTETVIPKSPKVPKHETRNIQSQLDAYPKNVKRRVPL